MQKWSILIITMIFILSGCGQVSRNTADISPYYNDPEQSSSPAPDTGAAETNTELAEFKSMVSNYAQLIGPQSRATETITSTKEPTTKTTAYAILAAQDNYAYWQYENKTRVINGQNEQVQNKYRYIDINGNPFNYAYNPKTAKEPYSYMERYQDIYGNNYESHFHEKITFTSTEGYIQSFANDSYVSYIHQYYPDKTLTISDRKTTYNFKTLDGTGSMNFTCGTMSGTLTLTLTKGVFSGNTILKANNKQALKMNIKNDNQISLETLVGKDTTTYYYNDLSTVAFSTDAANYIKIMDSGTYSTAINVTNIYQDTDISVASNCQPVFTNTMTFTNCSSLKISGLKFISADGANSLVLENIQNGMLSNCSFSKSKPEAQGSTMIILKNGTSLTAQNCQITGSSSKKSTGVIINGCQEADIVFDNTSTISSLKYGIHVVWGGTTGPLNTCGVVMTNNQTNIYRGGL